MRSIRGIGPKIASFFLRDVAICYEIGPDQDRELLQPVDRWILRFAQLLDDQLPRSAVSQWMANAGMWYFGARIAPKKFTYTRALGDPAYARQLAEEHVSDFVREK
jgi:hypothetical protein